MDEIFERDIRQIAAENSLKILRERKQKLKQREWTLESEIASSETHLNNLRTSAQTERLIKKGALLKLADFALRHPKDMPGMDTSNLNLQSATAKEAGAERIEELLIARKLEEQDKVAGILRKHENNITQLERDIRDKEKLISDMEQELGKIEKQMQEYNRRTASRRSEDSHDSMWEKSE